MGAPQLHHPPHSHFGVPGARGLSAPGPAPLFASLPRLGAGTRGAPGFPRGPVASPQAGGDEAERGPQGPPGRASEASALGLPFSPIPAETRRGPTAAALRLAGRPRLAGSSATKGGIAAARAGTSLVQY